MWFLHSRGQTNSLTDELINSIFSWNDFSQSDPEAAIQIIFLNQ